MNKFLSLFVLIFLIISFNQTFSGDRMVIVERFTSSTCPPCASNNPVMDAFLSAQDPEKIVGLSYHMSWPSPGNDPMYWYNPADNDARRQYYGVNSIPQARMDGLINIQPAYNQGTLQAYFDSRTNILSPVSVIVTDSTFGDSVMVRARIYCETILQNPNIVVHFVVFEKHIHYNQPPGTNGEMDFYDVMRKMLPGGSGTAVTMLPGQVYTFERKYRNDPIWQLNQIKVLVFVQTSLQQEVLNVGMKTLNFTLLPQPGYRVVQQGQSQSASYKVRTPVIVNGYNSPITFTSSVEPPTSGVTVSFPNGNVLSNFNDSLSVEVASTSSVPAGAYRIILTGTNTNNKSHKTSVLYLVGQNYVVTSSNKFQLQYKVDNTTYTTPQLFVWNLNSSHNLAAVTPQTVGATRYVFQSWSNNGDTSQNITVNTNASNYVVNYKTQYKLVTGIQPSGIPATINGGNLFYDSSTTASFSVTPTQVQYNNQTWYFQRWQGTGNGSYSGTQPSYQVTMNNIIGETAIFDTIPIGIKNQNLGVPKEYALHQNYPNPFNPVTRIKFDIPHSGHVKLVIYDILGNTIAILNDSQLQAGYYLAEFSGDNISSGIYIYKIETENYSDVKRMVLIK